MKFSVAYTFEPGLIEQLGRFPQVYEVFGKLDRDFIGGGRSTYTLRPVSKEVLADTVRTAHAHAIQFNYLLNGATLGGIEQTRSGHKKIRRMLDMLSELQVDSVTVASPFLLRLIKTRYPHFKVRVSAFAVIDSAHKARQWESMGADTLCISAIACNRDFTTLQAIRNAVQCDLQLIANASCLLHCGYELTHMNMLTQSSRKGDWLKGMCLDYCFVNCSSARLKEPLNFFRATWIRPEDLQVYERLGYHNFKILERSCPSALLRKRVEAYVKRSFDGNLWELVAPVAQIKKQQHTPLRQRLRMIAIMFHPHRVKVKSLLAMKQYAETVIPHAFDKNSAPVYIDNKMLDGFVEGLSKRNCSVMDCTECRYCQKWIEKSLTINEEYRCDVLHKTERLDQGFTTASHWI